MPGHGKDLGFERITRVALAGHFRFDQGHARTASPEDLADTKLSCAKLRSAVNHEFGASSPGVPAKFLLKSSRNSV